MLRGLLRQPIRALTTVRSHDATKPIVSLINSEDRYLFEGETLSDEENRAAIPQKPEIKNITKIHREMLAPLHVADVLTSPTINDTFFTTLANSSPLFGEDDYKVVPMDKRQEATTVHLLFGNITVDYMAAWNSQIRSLQPIPEDFLAPTLNQQAVEEIEKTITGYESMSELIGHLLQTTRAVYNSKEVLSGRIDHSLLPSILTLDKVLIFLLQAFSPRPDEFDLLINTVRDHLSLFTQDSLRRVLETLISRTPTQTEYIQVLCDFLSADIFSLPYYGTLVRDLHPVLLDKLSNFFSLHSDSGFRVSDEFLQVIVSENFFPSEETFQSFIRCYANHLSNTDYPSLRAEFNRTLAPYKSVFLARPVPVDVATLLLQCSVDNVTDLEHFLNLMHQEHNRAVLAEISIQVIKKVDKIVEDPIKALTLSKILKRFSTDSIVLDDQSKRLCGNIYATLQSSNVRVFNE